MRQLSICAILAALVVLSSSLFDRNASRESSASEPSAVSPDAETSDQNQELTEDQRARRPLLYVREAKGTVDEVVKKLEEAAAANKFGVLTVHNLKQKLNAKGVEFGPECRIVEVCNPRKAKTVLEADMSISNALPCRISIYEEDGKVKISTLRPTAILGLFGRPELEPVAKEVEQAMIRMIDAACR